MRPNDDIIHLIFEKSDTEIAKLGTYYLIRSIKDMSVHNRQKTAGGKEIMTKEQLGDLIIASEESMYHVAKTLLRNDADCADAIQEAIVKAFSSIHTLRKDSFGKTWLVRILINECYAIMRQERKLVPMGSYALEESKEQEAFPENSEYLDLYEAISRLSEEIRLTVTLYYMEGYSIKEIAALMNTTESTIKNRLARARAKLKSELEWAE